MTAIEKQMNELAQKAFESHSFDFTPLFPNILVRVFDFEDTTTNSLIIKPQTAQTPTHRAIVVRVWKPKEFATGTIESELSVGDLVTIPFYAGVATGVEKLDDNGYRIVPENKMRDFKTGRVISTGSTQETPHIYFKCGMFDKRDAMSDVILKCCGHNSPDTIDAILKEYDIVPKLSNLAQS